MKAQKTKFLNRTTIIALAGASLLFAKTISVVGFAAVGNTLYSQTQYGDARLLYDMTWPHLIDAEVIHYNIGQTLYYEKKYQPAEKEYRLALNSMANTDPRQCAVRIQLVNAQLRPLENEFDQGRIQDHRALVSEAIATLKGCLQIDPKNADAAKNIATLEQALDSKGKPKPTNSPDTKDDQQTEEDVKKNDEEARRQQKERNQDRNDNDYGPNW